jgi:hypothetical protein
MKDDGLPIAFHSWTLQCRTAIDTRREMTFVPNHTEEARSRLTYSVWFHHLKTVSLPLVALSDDMFVIVY